MNVDRAVLDDRTTLRKAIEGLAMQAREIVRLRAEIAERDAIIHRLRQSAWSADGPESNCEVAP